MIEMHWSWLAFAAVIEAVVFFILGALDGVAEEKEYYTQEMDAEWAEFIQGLSARQGGK